MTINFPLTWLHIVEHLFAHMKSASVSERIIVGYYAYVSWQVLVDHLRTEIDPLHKFHSLFDVDGFE